ncbi:MAG: hypothetical protein R2848_02500 [Thermomicrobiales bacterium]
MGRRFALSRWLVLALVLATLAAPLAAPGLLGSRSSPSAALAQDDQTGSEVNTGDTGEAAIPTDVADDQTAEEPTGVETDGTTTDEMGDGDTSAAQPPTEVVEQPTDVVDVPTDVVEEPTDVVEIPTDTTTPEAAEGTVEVAADEVVIPAALPAGVINLGCIALDPSQPDLRQVTLDVFPAAGYSAPVVTVTLTLVGGGAGDPTSGPGGMSSNPYTGTGSWYWGPTPGYSAISVSAVYTNLATGQDELASGSIQCHPAATYTPTNTPSVTRTATQTPDPNWTSTPSRTPSNTRTPTQTPDPNWTSTPTRTATNTPDPNWTSTPSRTPSVTRTSTPFGTPDGSVRITCGNSTVPGAGVYTGVVTVTGPGYAIANWSLKRADGTFLYGGPVTIPPTTNPIFVEEGNFVQAFLNVVYYHSDGTVFAVANASGVCDLTPGNTWTPTATATATPDVTNTSTASATSTATNTATDYCHGDRRRSRWFRSTQLSRAMFAPVVSSRRRPWFRARPPG